LHSADQANDFTPQLGFTEHQHFVAALPVEQIGATTSGTGIREVDWGPPFRHGYTCDRLLVEEDGFSPASAHQEGLFGELATISC
jgi:hypothetical protein